MSEEFKIEIVNPEKSFFSKEDVTEVVVPAFADPPSNANIVKIIPSFFIFPPLLI